MNRPNQRWKNITRQYFINLWVKNETGVMNLWTKQQKMQPVSVEQARLQVRRLKDQSHSTVKKGLNTTNK